MLATSSRHRRRFGLVGGLAAFALAVAACSSGGGSTSNPTGSSGPAVKGGTLNMLGAGDVDYMDPNVVLLLRSAPSPPDVEQSAVHQPGDRGADDDRRPRPRDRAPDDRQRRASARTGRPTPSRSANGAKWNTSPARQVTAADVVRGVKRTCNPVQPFGGLPDYESLIEGFQSFCDGFSEGAGDRGRDQEVRREHPPARRGRQERAHGRVPPGAPGGVLRRHAHDDRVLARAGGDAELPAREQGPRPAHDLRRALPDRVADTRPSRSSSPATPRGTRRPTRSARPTSTRSSSTRR